MRPDLDSPNSQKKTERVQKYFSHSTFNSNYNNITELYNATEQQSNAK